MENPKVTLTQDQINQAINAFEEASRVLNNLNENFITSEDISNLQEEVNDAWKTLSQTQHKQIYQHQFFQKSI